MNLVNNPIFESQILLFETERGEFAGVFEGNNILVKLNGQNIYRSNSKLSEVMEGTYQQLSERQNIRGINQSNIKVYRKK